MAIPVMEVLEIQKQIDNCPEMKIFKEFFDISSSGMMPSQQNLGLFLQLLFFKLDLKYINSKK
jgi:hypothetical protein